MSITYSIQTDSPQVLLSSIIVEMQRRCEAASNQVLSARTKRDSIRHGAELSTLTSVRLFLEAIKIAPPDSANATGGAAS